MYYILMTMAINLRLNVCKECTCYRRSSHLPCSHFSRQSVHLNINVTVTMVIQKLFINSYIIVYTEMCPLYIHMKYFNKSVIVLLKFINI